MKTMKAWVRIVQRAVIGLGGRLLASAVLAPGPVVAQPAHRSKSGQRSSPPHAGGAS
jgi:hypothetical protein